MELSLGPFLTCLTTSMILTVYFYYVLYRKKTFFAQGKRFVFIGIILIGRMAGEKSQIRKAEKGISGVGERAAFEGLGNQKEETFLMIRSADLLPAWFLNLER